MFEWNTPRDDEYQPQGKTRLQIQPVNPGFPVTEFVWIRHCHLFTSSLGPQRSRAVYQMLCQVRCVLISSSQWSVNTKFTYTHHLLAQLCCIWPSCFHTPSFGYHSRIFFSAHRTGLPCIAVSSQDTGGLEPGNWSFVLGNNALTQTTLCLRSDRSCRAHFSSLLINDNSRVSRFFHVICIWLWRVWKLLWWRHIVALAPYVGLG